MNPEIAAINQAKSNLLAAIQAAGAENPGAGGAGSGQTDFEQAVAAVQADQKCSKTHAMQVVVRQQPELHKAYLQRRNPGMTL